MIDREKVVKGLECCLSVTKCGTCPYNTGHDLWCGNTDQLLDDALALLKAQEPEYPIRKQSKHGWFFYCPKCGIILNDMALFKLPLKVKGGAKDA